jgi:hypothetical protein
MSDKSSERRADRLVRPLPPNPSLNKQRKLAKALARDYWRGKPKAIARVHALHPKPPTSQAFALSDAQLVIARGYGFANWPQMKRKIESLTKSPVELFQAAVETLDHDPSRLNRLPSFLSSSPGADAAANCSHPCAVFIRLVAATIGFWPSGRCCLGNAVFVMQSWRHDRFGLSPKSGL